MNKNLYLLTGLVGTAVVSYITGGYRSSQQYDEDTKNRLEKDISKSRESLNALRHSHHTQLEKYSNLCSDYVELEKKYNNLETRMDPEYEQKLLDEIKNLKNTNNKLNKRIKTLDSTVKEIANHREPQTLWPFQGYFESPRISITTDSYYPETFSIELSKIKKIRDRYLYKEVILTDGSTHRVNSETFERLKMLFF